VARGRRLRRRLDGDVVAAVERKTLEDLAGSLLSGKLTYALADLSALPRAAVVVEDRYSRLFKLPHASGSRVAEALAEAQARFPRVPVVFCETRPLAQEWTYRWLGACLAVLGAASACSLAQPQVVVPASSRAVIVSTSSMSPAETAITSSYASSLVRVRRTPLRP
jgi:hypothetical protein